MAVLDRVLPKTRAATRPVADPLEEEFLAKINHGRENLQRSAPKRDEAWEFVRGNHFAYVNDQNKLSFLSSGGVGIRRKGKPPYQSRQARNFIFDVVRREASNASQQVPSYQVVPSTSEPEDVSAASLSEKILLYGYNRWSLRRATVDAVMHAVVGGEAFAWVYFDTTIGPFIGEGVDSVGAGDVRVRIYGGNECYWVPGLRFHESPWHCVEQAVEPSSVKAMPGFMGGTLTPDAQTRSLSGRGTSKGKLVMVTHYLERPCPAWPKGRWITLANQRRILPDRDYPGTGEEPVLRPLTYTPDPENDRDLGLVPQILDPQRTIDDSENKAVEWKNLALYPQWVVPPGFSKKQRRTGEPGKVYESARPEDWKQMDVMPIPDGLFQMGDRATEHLLRIAGQSDPPAGVDSGKGQQVWIEKNRAAGAMFVSALAEWHSNVAHDCLYQAQQNYTEPRLITFRGDFGWESITDFKGSQLRDQIDVRVSPDSIEPETAQAREQKLMNFVQLGAIPAEKAFAAIETGSTEGLIRSYAMDQARVGRIISRLKNGTFLTMPTLPTGRLQKVPQQATDPATGQPAFDSLGNPVIEMVDSDQPEVAPAWMPRYSDDLGIFRSTWEDWLKSEDYEEMAGQYPPVPPGMVAPNPPRTIGDIAGDIYAGVLKLEAEKDAEAAAAQSAQAEQLGMNNATRPPQPKPNPSLPGLEPPS